MLLNWDTLNIHLYQCSCSRWLHGLPTDKTWPRRMHDNDLWICCSGKGTLYIDSEKFEIFPGRIFWFRPGPLYNVAQDVNDPLTMYFMHFDLFDADGNKYYPTREKVPFQLSSFHNFNWYTLASDINHIMSLGSIPGVGHEQRNDVQKIANSMARALLTGIDFCHSMINSSNLSPRLNNIALEAAAYFSKSSNKFQTVEKTARHFGLSRSRFTRIFTDFWKMSPQEYQINQRIEQAKHLLRNTALSINEIADTLGYTEPYFFSRQFKKFTGQTAKRFRDSYNKGH